MTLEPGLYITATPIGNLGDITYRAVECLRSADLILCEDTRQTAKLCDAYTITTRREAYHDHNGARPPFASSVTQAPRSFLTPVSSSCAKPVRER